MSDDYLCVIPTDPNLVPSAERREAVRAVLAALAPEAEAITSTVYDVVEFISAYRNFSSIRCPRCDSTVDLDWWKEQMDTVAEQQFSKLDVRVPCCASTVSLNDLVYDWPQGFARWSVEAFTPMRNLLEPDEEAALADALGQPVRVIWQHI